MSLIAEALSVRLGKTTVLHDVTADIAPATITAICGPNGAGKSTLLSCLAGLTRPSTGTVTLEGNAMTSFHPREKAQRIGYLPQAGEIAWDISVRSLVALGRIPHGDRDETSVVHALDAVDLTSFSSRPVSTLSGGERARVLLARVLAGQPEWILADEPLAALDLGHQLALLELLRSVAREGVGVVLVVHDLALAMNYADRVLVLDAGCLVADGPAEKALSAEMIDAVWKVRARWSGCPGERALLASLP
ncbi:ABC transporter ATP-binding protein [Altericroceibacterium xinjiangense]|uniref:ABC transporter ATP-binding protein n=1 Tax=Altericroceibacterium xinjiangense TaxID=762261 RepID=UPI000F7E4364|nr:ABC transporter ATP-binding protein [Altericroceibacterium xinjiangense]